MFTIKRNQVIITALVVMIAVAGYLNYIDTTTPISSDTLTYNDSLDMGKSLVVDDATGQEVMVVNADKSLETVIVPIDGEIGSALTLERNNSVALSDLSDQTNNVTADDITDDSGTAVFVNSTSDSSFFVQAKLDREQSRSKQKETLTELINNENVAKEQKSDCANSMLEIQQRIEKETSAEALIEAKGFAEAYVRIDNDTVDVVVSKAVLSDAEIAQIEDIVKRKTGIESENIRVAPLKAN